MSGKKHHNKTHNLPFRRACSVSGHSSEQNIAHYNCITANTKLSQTICQIHLMITNHRGQKFPTSLTLVSFNVRFEWLPTLLSMLSTTATFTSGFSTFAVFKVTSKFFRVTVVFWWKKQTWFFHRFIWDLYISQLNSVFAVIYLFQTSDARFKCGSDFTEPINSLLRIATSHLDTSTSFSQSPN